jgi:SAM-dependent methyltransferase
MEVIEHIDNYDKAISEMARLLKQGGILAITWPFIYGMHDFPADYHRFSEFAMEKILQRHGLSIIQLTRRGGCLGVLHTILGQYSYGSIKALTHIPWVGTALKPLQHAAQCITQATYWLHYALAHQSCRNKLAAAGDGLRGIPGVLALWTLGYCAIARKD